MYIDRMEERIFVYAETLRGLLNGKTIADLQSAINALGVNIDLHTKNHPEGELRELLEFKRVNR